MWTLLRGPAKSRRSAIPVTYTAAVERHGPMWLVTIVELGFMHAVDRLDRVEYTSRQLIAERRRTDPESFDIRITDGGGFAL